MTTPATGTTLRAILARFPSAARRYKSDVAGATAIEYALIASLIIVATVTAMQTYSSNMTAVYERISTAVATN